MAVVETEGAITIKLIALERTRAHLQIEYVTEDRTRTLTGGNPTKLVIGQKIAVLNVQMYHEE